MDKHGLNVLAILHLPRVLLAVIHLVGDHFGRAFVEDECLLETLPAHARRDEALIHHLIQVTFGEILLN